MAISSQGRKGEFVSCIDNMQGRREHKHDLNVHGTQKNAPILFYDYIFSSRSRCYL